MLVIPAIDLKEGRCVRLYQGDFAQETVVNPDPVKQAIAFEKAGAKVLHIVDLDGALSGDLTNLQVIQAILSAITIPIQVGGGIRSMAQVARYLDAGVSRVIIGSKAVEDPAFVAEAVQQYGDQIAVGVIDEGAFFRPAHQISGKIRLVGEVQHHTMGAIRQ